MLDVEVSFAEVVADPKHDPSYCYSSYGRSVFGLELAGGPTLDKCTIPKDQLRRLREQSERAITPQILEIESLDGNGVSLEGLPEAQREKVRQILREAQNNFSIVWH